MVDDIFELKRILFRTKQKLSDFGQKGKKVCEIAIVCGCIFSVILIYIRAFYGTEITDEAYYVSDAMAMLNGNIPYAYNNSSMATGSAFLIIPILFVYQLFCPEMKGVLLITRLCFVTFRVLIIIIIFFILKKKVTKFHAMLLAALLIPVNGAQITVPNYSYNTVPFYVTMLSAFILYDTLEQEGKGYRLKLIAAGFMMAIACFANPGYGVALLVFIGLILCKAQGKKGKCKSVALFLGGVFIEILVVIVPIMFQTSAYDLLYGLYRLFINSYPAEALNPTKSVWAVVNSFWNPSKRVIAILIMITAFVYWFSRKIVYENGKLLDKKRSVILAIACSMVANMTFVHFFPWGRYGVDYLGYIGAIYCVIFLFTGMWEQEKISWYLGIYPILFSVAEIVLVSSGAGMGRFYYSFPVFFVVFLYLLGFESKYIRVVTVLAIAMLIVSMGFDNYKYVYRDESIGRLDSRVESGVYKGLLTTADRARDLPELEEYLNSVIGKDETYAFRDNVPSAYLMMHHGRVCEPSTWDVMNYSYGRNAPALMFDYYRRRGMIPDKIIYIDYGRDENMSIETDIFRYNDFVNANYDLVDDFTLNNTYTHIMVFQNNGNFDGNYDWWIDTYYGLIDKE